jgi:hypothetical protein
VLVTGLQLLHAHLVSIVNTVHSFSTNILAKQALFQLQERLAKLVVQVAQVVAIVARADFLTQTTHFVLPQAIFVIQEQIKEPLAPLDKHQQLEIHVLHVQQTNSA